MKRIIILLLLFSSLGSMAQTYQENLEKYWYYRHRLKAEWMYDSGNNQRGDNSIPETMGIYEDCLSGFSVNYLNYADQTWWLGHYMGVLATEYKLLKDNGQDTDETLHDIHKALETLERLDLTGELCFTGGTATENGFFIRDDVPDGFDDNFPNINSVSSDYINVCGQQDHGNEMSQDQVWGLFIGLRLLKEFIDVPNYDIPDRVVDVTDRIINAMHFTNWLGFEEWVILNPVTGEPVDGGDNVKPLSWAFAKIATDITGINQQTPTSLLWKPVFENAQKNILLQLPITPPSCFDCSNMSSYHDVTANANNSRVLHTAYGILTLTALTDYMILPEFRDAYLYLQWFNLETRKGGGYYNMEKGLYPHLIALNKVLFGNLVPDMGAGFYEFFLNSAPSCGAYHYRDLNNNHLNSAPPWHTMSLFCPSHCDGLDESKGHFNMLDYMLLYNLYFINYLEGEIPYRKITNDFPTQYSGIIGTKEIKTEIITAARQIDIYSNVYSTGDVKFIAGEKIRFLNGFHAYKNSHVHAYIDNSLNHEIYYNETTSDPCNGQGSVCNKCSSFLDRKKLNNGKEKEIKSEENINTQQDDFIKVYPNPVKAFIKVECNEMIDEITVQSIEGKVLIKNTINTKTYKLYLKTIPSGIYIVIIQNKRNVYIKKIIKR